MSLPVSYMGTKRRIASVVADIAAVGPPGAFLDLFSGMCSVAAAVAPKRNVWTNDLQYFAHNVAQSTFCDGSPPPLRMDIVAVTSDRFFRHIRAHVEIASTRLEAEEAALASESALELQSVYKKWEEDGALSLWDADRKNDATLFRDLYAGAYFSLSQCIEIDAVRFSLDGCLRDNIIDPDTHRWLLLALCVALNKCSTSTGHFAQPLSPKPNNLRRYIVQRRRSIRDEWLAAFDYLSPIGTADWRIQNRAYRSDAIEFMSSLLGTEQLPGVVYADPPYTCDQYSRYYHVYDTLIRYDYPSSSGRGRYRDDRSVSAFSLATQISNSMDRLIEECARVGADMILSYPTNGLLRDSRDIIPRLIRQHYGRKPDVVEIRYDHSTMGGSKGLGKQAVTEVLYRAYH